MLSNEVTTLQISSPPGAALQPFPGAPALNAAFSRVRLRFSHDGSKLLAAVVGSRSPRDAGLWVMPWPPGNGRKIETPRVDALIKSADWLLDDRHIVLDTTGAVGFFNGGRLLLIDSESEAAWPLTPDNADAAFPSVGPDGRILYVSPACSLRFGRDTRGRLPAARTTSHRLDRIVRRVVANRG